MSESRVDNSGAGLVSAGGHNRLAGVRLTRIEMMIVEVVRRGMTQVAG